MYEIPVGLFFVNFWITILCLVCIRYIKT